MEADLARLLRYVGDHGPASLAKCAKALGLAQSELRRLLAVLGSDADAGGLGLVDEAAADGRSVLALSARGRDWLEQHG